MDAEEKVQKPNKKLKQSWWHIEDEIEPADGRLIFRVQDIYIEKQYYKMDNTQIIKMPPYFVGFKVRNKNSGKELSFIADYNNSNDKKEEIVINVNLGPESDWPEVTGTEYRHIKIQFEYIDFWAVFEKRANHYIGAKRPPEKENKPPEKENKPPEKENTPTEKSSLIRLKNSLIGFIISTSLISYFLNYKKDDLDYVIKLPQSKKKLIPLILIPGYTGQFKMSGDSQGEISITVPLGMNIKHHGKSTKIHLHESPNDKKPKIMHYRKPHITHFNDRLKYHYIINNKSYKYVLKRLKQNSDIEFNISYNVVNDIKFFIVPLLSIIVFGIAIISDLNAGNYFYFIVLLLSLSTLYLTLRKEKYQIPYNNIVLVLIILSVPFLIIKPIIIHYLLEILVITEILESFGLALFLYRFKSLIITKEAEKKV